MEYTVDAVREALGVLMIVAHNPGLGVTEIAKRSGNTKARAFRFLATLEQADFVARDRNATSYSLGPMSLVLGLAAQEQVGITRLAEKYLERLNARFNEHCALSVRDGDESVTVAHKHSTHDLRVQGALGRRRPLHAGASGKVHLAYAPPEVQAGVLEGELRKFTAHTLTSRVKLKQELKRILQAGAAVSVSEMAEDVIAVAAPVFGATGEAEAAMSVSLPSSRAPKDLDALLEAVKQAAAQLSAELGAPPA